jgi:ABC-type lipoprotein export system ATPase subunit
VALVDVDLTVTSGEVVAVVGPSGAGKSTLLHVAGGIDCVDAGRVCIDGVDVSTLAATDRAALRRRSIGFIFQFFHLLPALSVAENVVVPMELDGRRPDDRTTADLLDRVGLGHRADHRPSELSGGEMQRAAIARALSMRPALILADEPTGNLDSVTGAAVIDLLLDQVAEDGSALVLVTHDAAVAARADRVVELRDGALG